jgi:hypothetical protein
VFTPSSLEHLAERDIDADDATDAGFGRYGPARIRRGRGERTRWFIIAPVVRGDLMTCVLRAAHPCDLADMDTFVIPAAREKRPEFNWSMRVCISARMSSADKIRGYRAWRRSKGER